MFLVPLLSAEYLRVAKRMYRHVIGDTVYNMYHIFSLNTHNAKNNSKNHVQIFSLTLTNTISTV